MMTRAFMQINGLSAMAGTKYRFRLSHVNAGANHA